MNKNKKNKKILSFLPRYSGILAAVICVAVLLPADGATKQLTDGMVLKEVSVYVMSVSKSEFLTEKDIATGTLCTVKVLEEASHVFTVGEEIVVRLPLTSSWMIEEKESYKIDIRYESGEEYPFVIVK